MKTTTSVVRHSRGAHRDALPLGACALALTASLIPPALAAPNQCKTDCANNGLDQMLGCVALGELFPPLGAICATAVLANTALCIYNCSQGGGPVPYFGPGIGPVLVLPDGGTILSAGFQLDGEWVMPDNILGVEFSVVDVVEFDPETELEAQLISLGSGTLDPRTGMWSLAASMPKTGEYFMVIAQFTELENPFTLAAITFAIVSPLVAQEGFSYDPAGNGLESYAPGGEGWANGWTGADSWLVEPDSLAYADADGLVLSTSGNRLEDNAGNQSRAIQLGGHPDFGNEPGVLWLSMLARQTSGGANSNYLGIQLPCSGPNAFLFLGKPFGKSTWGVDAATGPANHIVSTTPSSALSFLVLRIDFREGPDDVHMWVNPSLASEPSLAAADVTALGYGDFQGVNSIRAQVGGPGITGTLDEVRVGLDYVTVAPQVTARIGDLTGDGLVNAADLAQLLANWGDCGDCPADLNGDGLVNAADLATVLANWS